MAGGGGEGLLRLPRCAHQQSCPLGIPSPCRRTLAPRPAQTQPEGSNVVDRHGARLADRWLPKPPDIPSLACPALPRQTPKVWSRMREFPLQYGSVRGAPSDARPWDVAPYSARSIYRRAARKAVSSRMRPFGQRTCAVDLAPLLRAPLLMPDGIQGRGLPLILVYKVARRGALRCSSPGVVAKSERLDSWNRRVQGHLGCELCERSAKAAGPLRMPLMAGNRC